VAERRAYLELPVLERRALKIDGGVLQLLDAAHIMDA
jgi:hypothetical protein